MDQTYSAVPQVYMVVYCLLQAMGTIGSVCPTRCVLCVSSDPPTAQDLLQTNLT